ncbi:CU044_5270 family protein [Streptomyces sp. Ag109_G2-15]|uniref:CU044_5270 family protein n=1 Tax=Streptomyces sp. Ag109_G2-15 TaxID=1938850 RepID=UPI000BCA05F7|nr:CU044_5270 family protein [Streptomyces sp. Ag109_G2-15]SOD91278.1 hypothetical protein SAMN06272765_6865 [Streptomyces sp. Ag109_G2-15]
MDELTMVRGWDTDQHELSDEARAAARARLRAAMVEESRSGASRGRALSRRLVVRTALVGVTAAAVGVTVVVAHDTKDDDKPRLGAISATEVLQKAADRSRAVGNDLPIPRNDQYFYTKTYITQTPVKGGKTRTWTDESWMSVDGSKPSLRQEHGKIHHDPPLGKHEVRSPPTVYSKLKTMPTDPDKLLAQFRGGQPSTTHNDMFAFFEGSMLLMGPRVMPPGLQAGAFEALAKLPRIRLDYDDVDVAGRSAVGVSYPKTAFTFLFDRKTYDYLGLRTKGSSPKKVHGEWKQSNWYYETRILQDTQVVDRIGQHD